MNVIELAKEAGLLDDDEAWVSPHQEAMERFAAIVRAEALAEPVKQEPVPKTGGKAKFLYYAKEAV